MSDTITKWSWRNPISSYRAKSLAAHKARWERMQRAEASTKKAQAPLPRNSGKWNPRSSRANSMSIGTIITVDQGGRTERFQRGNNGDWHIFGNPRMGVTASYVDGQMSNPNASVGVDGRQPSFASKPQTQAQQAAASKCGARTRDGSRCGHLITVGPCAAGHRRRNRY